MKLQEHIHIKLMTTATVMQVVLCCCKPHECSSTYIRKAFKTLKHIGQFDAVKEMSVTQGMEQVEERMI